ncbi:MAG: SoxR reducing system RseC family protein [Clostridia bacterium]|nr:SoxR reducing system RseC family protein [Clostridia bacterium]MBQ8716724.1 SoxR reducing system RseC family protein [Clostridia bacterium]
MKTKATVVEIIDQNVAVVSVERRAACDGCHKAVDGKGCSVCTLLGSKGETRALAKNTVGAALGDTVEVESRTRRIIGYAALVFLLPVALAIVGYLLGSKLSLGEGVSLLLALGGLLISFLLIFLYSKLVVSRRLDIEIVAIVKEAEQQE